MYSSAYRGSGAPPWVLRPSRGGVPPEARRGECGAAVPLAGLQLSVGRGGREGREGGGGLPVVPIWSPRAAPCWLRGGGLVVLAPGG